MSPQILNKDDIEKIVTGLDLLPAIEEGYALYSAGQAVVPPVGELLLDQGEVHIKYGYIHDDPYYVIKIASGFYSNPELGLSSSNGLMLLFSQQTGELVCVFLDEGYLTDVRTAIGGAIAAKFLAPRKVNCIGIVGTGIQAALQLRYLKQVVDCRDVLVWGRGDKQLMEYRQKMNGYGLNINTTRETADILNTCNLVVTTTPSTLALLQATDISTGVHITAVGADTPDKQELDTAIIKRADLVVADSIAQCLQRGEICQAVKAGFQPEKLTELGNIVRGVSAGRIDDQQITVADMTGVAVQDIKIAEAVFLSQGGE